MLPTLDESVRTLAVDSERVRIKKLLIYVCKSSWESDPYRLDYFDLYSLVRELLQIAPTRQQLRTRLETFVRTLSKADEYMAIGDRIYENLEPFLNEDPPQATEGDRQRYRSVALQLQQEPEQVRIKKLIYYACSQIWENNPAVLSQLDLADLLERLHQQTSTYETCSTLLTNIVRTLNRQDFYFPISQRIQMLLRPIYEEDSQIGESTQVITFARSAPPESPKRPTAVAAPPVPPPPPPPSTTTQPPKKTTDEPPDSESDQPKALDFDNLMDVRLQVMKYCNPLRAKMLLHAALSSRPIRDDPRDWSILKSNDLGELLKQTHEQFTSYAELDIKLGTIVNALGGGDRFTQIAQAILRALKPYYPDDANLPTPSHAATADNSHVTDVGVKKDMTVPNDSDDVS
ncbi:hypothetical protein [Vacuolonema iberomarrocanum]|uniref:hypothetical protein n=1 Tax=Vacuolonema iberomarrocanum TaxID=3454632 RepID=UPI0019F2D376|nr:hypothetical protein [filamentous cyanobacterium LEGE 07170]